MLWCPAPAPSMPSTSAAAVEVREHIAHLLLGHDDLEVHDRLEQIRLRVLDAGLQRERPRDLEGHLARVDLVERAVVKHRLEVRQRIAGDHTLQGLLADALLHRGPEVAWDRAADD